MALLNMDCLVMTLHRPLVFAILALGLGVAVPALGVVVAGPQQRNTTPPTGALANAGWQWQGQFGWFMGTPIGPSHFLTAKHIGHGVGTPIYYPNASGALVAYPTIAEFNDSSTDLRIMQIAGTFDSWAPMWDASVDGSEVGRPMFVVGRGASRGEEIWGPSSSASPTSLGRKPVELKGWLWGADDRVQAWGTNVVDGIVNGGASVGQLLYFDFDRGASNDEAMLSGGDSGGGLFVQNSLGQWKLAAINYAAQYQFSRTNGGTSFNATLFDMGGLYYVPPDPDLYIPEEATDKPAKAYSTRVSSRLAWINSVVGGGMKPDGVVPEPSLLAPLAAASLLLRRRR